MFTADFILWFSLFQIAGIGLIAAGAYVKIKLTEYYEFFGSNYMGPGILLIIVGVIIFLLAFFGCCGAIKENYCLTMTVSKLAACVNSMDHSCLLIIV